MHISAIILFSAVLQISQGDDEEYEYVDDDETDIVSKGTRLVGASRADAEQLSFLVGYNLNIFGGKYSTCTGSLITNQWMISAAHCILAIVDTENIPKCVDKTNRGAPYKNTEGREITCHLMEDGSIKIGLKPMGTAWVGVSDINKFNNKNHKGLMVDIDMIVRHAHSYRGGGDYGDYGGHDIALLHLALPLPATYVPACLPSPHFKDSGIGPGYLTPGTARLAGYGRYTREPCMTDNYGRSKFHYCVADKCQTSDPPPSHPECDKFFSDPNTPNKIPAGDEELIIMTNSNEIMCNHKHSPGKGSKGWCQVNERVRSLTLIEDGVDSWGFCSKDCHIPTDAESSVLREKNDVDILDDRLCEKFVSASTQGKKVEVYPHVICIGYLKHRRYSVWRKTADGSYTATKRKHHGIGYHMIDKDEEVYVYSAGTCSGDSGGPVFAMDERTKRYIVLGAVSGGRGHLGACGGFDNPTHYVRLSAFVDWFKKMLGKDFAQVCFSAGHQKKLKTRTKGNRKRQTKRRMKRRMKRQI